jgi:autotransporter passenger strand-loop-strand repeat protein
VLSGGTQYVQGSGAVSGTVLESGAVAYVSSAGVAAAATVSSGGKLIVFSGGTADGLALGAGGQLTDDGQVVFSGAGTLAGTLLGTGFIAESGGGDLVLSGDGAKFAGGAVVSGGTIELATADALGSGYVELESPATGSAVLQIDAADAPAAGGTFANVISNFNAAGEDIDLRSIAFVAGASATVVGTDLVLTDGGHTYTFELAGGAAGAYPVLSDGHGGTLIDPTAAASHKALDPKVLAFAHAAAAFAPSDAANTALLSSTSSVGQTPFAHAAASVR